MDTVFSTLKSDSPPPQHKETDKPKSNNLGMSAYVCELENRLQQTEDALQQRDEEFKVYFKLYIRMKDQADYLRNMIRSDAGRIWRSSEWDEDDFAEWCKSEVHIEEDEDAFKKYMAAQKCSCKTNFADREE